MPRNKPHRLGTISARIVRDGIEIEVEGQPPFTLAVEVAKRLGAVIAAALCEARLGAR
jgi:predicted DNA-binding protein